MHNFCLLNIKRPVLSSVFSLLLVVFGLYTFNGDPITFGDRTQIVHHLIAGHTNTVIIDGDGFETGAGTDDDFVDTGLGVGDIRHEAGGDSKLQSEQERRQARDGPSHRELTP